MKQKSHLFLLLIVLLSLSTHVWAYDFDDGTFKYTILSEKEKTVSCDGFTDEHKNDTKLEIVRNAYFGNKTYTVKTISENAFKDCCHIESLVIPQNITSIENYAFNDKHSCIS